MGLAINNGDLTLEQEAHAKKIGACYYELSAPPGTACFYCANEFGRAPEHVIHWMGADAHIFLHASCTTRLVIRLMNDVHGLECITNTKHVLVRNGE